MNIYVNFHSSGTFRLLKIQKIRKIDFTENFTKNISRNQNCWSRVISNWNYSSHMNFLIAKDLWNWFHEKKIIVQSYWNLTCWKNQNIANHMWWKKIMYDHRPSATCDSFFQHVWLTILIFQLVRFQQQYIACESFHFFSSKLKLQKRKICHFLVLDFWS